MLQKVVDPQRKSGDIEEVSHGQVHQVDAELIALAYLKEVMKYVKREKREEGKERRGSM